MTELIFLATAMVVSFMAGRLDGWHRGYRDGHSAARKHFANRRQK